MLRRSFVGGLAIVLATATVPSFAAGSWDGQWVGTVTGYGPISIAVTQNTAVQYIYLGQHVQINGSFARGKSISIDIGNGHGMARMVKTGPNSANYYYTSRLGDHASGTMERQ